MNERPKIDNAPGLTWRLLNSGWEGRWRPRTDLVKRGYPKSVVSLWGPSFEPPTETEAAYVSDRCNTYQKDMLAWARGGVPALQIFDGTLISLIHNYRTDPLSGYQTLRYNTRGAYDSRLKSIETAYGSWRLSAIKARELLGWHAEWLKDENGQPAHLSKAHDIMGMLRTLFGLGLTMLEDAECQRLSLIMSKMRFKMGKRRESFMTAEQAVAVRRRAHEVGYPSIALCQAIQFDGTLRQKDLIGEWEPLSEPGISEVTDGNDKWLRGARWEEVDQAFVFDHTTSKRQKRIKIPLLMCPMVVEELCIKAGVSMAELTRDKFPAAGPMIVFEGDGIPWAASTFRSYWRQIADYCGVPKKVWNMDSRAGAITEATLSGVPIEHAKVAATHSDVATTEGYSRGEDEKIANVLRMRAEFRNKPGT